MSKIYILTGPVNSGKTTKLMNWVEKKSNVGGILTPVVDGKRHLYSIASQKYKIFELENINEKKEIIQIGRFNFLKESFDWAIKEIEKSLNNNPHWLIIDEIGLLELEGKGFDSVLRTILKNEYDSTKLLLVIRERLVTDLLLCYGLKESDIHFVDFL